MVILSREVENVLDRIFLVGIAYNGKISPLYSKAKATLLNLDKSIANIYAPSINNAPFAWKRDNLLVLVVGKYMFSYEKNTLKDGSVGVIVHEVAENGRIITENRKTNISRIVTETINNYLRSNLIKA